MHNLAPLVLPFFENYGFPSPGLRSLYVGYSLSTGVWSILRWMWKSGPLRTFLGVLFHSGSGGGGGVGCPGHTSLELVCDPE